MLNRRRTRQLLLFLGNVVSGVVTVVVAFAVIAGSDVTDPAAPILIFAVALALSTCGWRFGLERRGRASDLAKRVAWQAGRVIIAWEAVPIVFVVTLIFLALTGIVTARDRPGDWSSTIIAILVFSALVVLALWFTWVKSRRMVDLLWPLPGMPQRGSESPYLKL
jgi:hypothetical protein